MVRPVAYPRPDPRYISYFGIRQSIAEYGSLEDVRITSRGHEFARQSGDRGKSEVGKNSVLRSSPVGQPEDFLQHQLSVRCLRRGGDARVDRPQEPEGYP